MVLYGLNRLINGDLIYALATWMVCALAYMLVLPARWPRWGKALYFLTLSFSLLFLAHLGVEALKIFWNTPLGEPLRIDRHLKGL